VIVYGIVDKVAGLRLSEEDEFHGADLAIHKISATNKDR
jgi:Amt family ammonium transporter